MRIEISYKEREMVDTDDPEVSSSKLLSQPIPIRANNHSYEKYAMTDPHHLSEEDNNQRMSHSIRALVKTLKAYKFLTDSLDLIVWTEI